MIIPNNVSGINFSEHQGLKDLIGEEWNTLKEIIDNLPKCSKDQYLYRSLFPIAFKIDSIGAKDFLNNYADPYLVIKRLLNTSGINPSTSYYSGKGSCLADLNQSLLFSLYLKLERLDEDKALAMARLVYNMYTLGATEFINSLFDLVANDYNLDECRYNRCNIS